MFDQELWIRDLISVARATDEMGFRRQLSPLVFVGDPEQQIAEGWQFMTAFDDEEQKADDPGIRSSRVFPIRRKKDSTNPQPETLLIGRSTTNDIRLCHGSVSKLHARIHLGANEEVTLSDASSRNGTFHNGNRVEAGVQATLQHGDIVVLGGLMLRVLAAERLHRVLVLMVPL